MVLKILLHYDRNKQKAIANALESQGYNVVRIDQPAFAAIINASRVTFIRTQKYEKNGHKREYYPNARILKSIFDANRLGTGKRIIRSDGEVYSSILELLQKNPNVNYPSKIYQAIKYNRSMYGYHWSYVDSVINQPSLF